jgi:hypothetical protein
MLAGNCCDDSGMTTPWWPPVLAAVGTVLAAILAGSFAVRNARKTPHETLKTLVDITQTAQLISSEDLQVLQAAIHREVLRIRLLNDARIEGFWQYQFERIRQLGWDRGEERRDAYLSYSGEHQLASRLQHAIGRVGKTWFGPPLVKVFLDDDARSAGPNLWAALERRLTRSSWLILLATPAAARSFWVDQEIDWWLKHRSAETLFLAVASGDLRWNPDANDFDADVSTALPPRLMRRFTHQPAWVSIAGPISQAPKKHASDLDTVAVDIVSQLLAVPKADLNRFLGEQRRTMRLLRRLLIASLILVTAVSVIAAVIVLT